jgi:hypothetical protein
LNLAIPTWLKSDLKISGSRFHGSQFKVKH